MRTVVAAIVVAGGLALWVWWTAPVRVAPSPAPPGPDTPEVGEPGSGGTRGTTQPGDAGTRPEAQPGEDSAPRVPGSATRDQPSAARAVEEDGLLVPVQGVARAQLFDTFGDARGRGRRHDAIDIMAPAGTPVLAVADGRIEKLFDSERGGLTIYHFEPGGRYAYYYGHLQAYAPGLAEGQRVRRGQVIGTVGSTGNASTEAPHLHFAIFRLGPERNWWQGEPVNPFPFLREGTTPR